MVNLSVVQKGSKFVVTNNGEPVLLPKTDGQSIVTEFDSKQDAEKYMNILSNLSKRKRYQKS